MFMVTTLLIVFIKCKDVVLKFPPNLPLGLLAFTHVQSFTISARRDAASCYAARTTLLFRLSTGTAFHKNLANFLAESCDKRWSFVSSRCERHNAAGRAASGSALSLFFSNSCTVFPSCTGGIRKLLLCRPALTGLNGRARGCF